MEWARDARDGVKEAEMRSLKSVTRSAGLHERRWARRPMTGMGVQLRILVECLPDVVAFGFGGLVPHFR